MAKKQRPGSRSVTLRHLLNAERHLQRAAHSLIEGEAGAKAMTHLQSALHATRLKIKAARAFK